MYYIVYVHHVSQRKTCIASPITHLNHHHHTCVVVWDLGANKSEKMSVLFEEWCAAGENWKSSEFVVQMKTINKTRRRGARKWMTKADLIKKYGSEDVAVAIIQGKESDKRLRDTQIRPHPEVPDRPEMQQYLCYDEESVVDQDDHIMSSLFGQSDHDSTAKGKKSKRKKVASESSGSGEDGSSVSSASSADSSSSGKTKKNKKKKDKNKKDKAKAEKKAEQKIKKKEKEKLKEQKKQEKANQREANKEKSKLKSAGKKVSTAKKNHIVMFINTESNTPARAHAHIRIA